MNGPTLREEEGMALTGRVSGLQPLQGAAGRGGGISDDKTEGLILEGRRNFDDQRGAEEGMRMSEVERQLISGFFE